MRIPVGTYRLQFNPEFGFRQVSEIVSYLKELGISDIYASPIFRAKKGSPHGYDVVDMNDLNPDLGTANDFEKLLKKIKKSGIGWIQDIVPNHMAFDGENRMLMDVLENGHHSKFIDFFDIEPKVFTDDRTERLLAPFLGKHYSEALDNREIFIEYDKGGFFIKYYSLKLPLKIETYVRVITHRLNILRKRLGEDHPDLIKFLGILYSLKNLPLEEEERDDRYSQIEFIKRILQELYLDNEEIRNFIDDNVAIFNGEGSSEDGLNLLDSLLAEQLFRLSFWKVATEELNYRRFFNINGLISVRIEDEEVFDRTHNLILKLVKSRKIHGLRIDHIDGLYDPTGYLRALREKAGDIFIVVEKILGHNEELPHLWAVQGTTGYDYVNHINRIFCDESNGSRFNRLYYAFSGLRTSYETLLYEKKKLLIEKDMTGDVDNLARLLKEISGKDRYGVDITLYGVKRAIIELLALFPVYRTYITLDSYSDADRRYMIKTIEKARDLNPGLLYEINFIERFLLLDFGEYLGDEDRAEWVHFVMRFQQLTGPLMAKGLEDTTLYVYNRLLSLNEVGGDPDIFGSSIADFHEFNLKRSRRQPHSMNATSTHDTKRGEDIRARLNVLSEMPDLWESSLKTWARLNRKKKKTSRGVVIPDKNDEYFLYQTLIGAMPFNDDEYGSFISRLKEYIVKAVREAKVHTAWLKPDTDYEKNFLAFIDRILDRSGDNQFRDEFFRFQEMVAFYGIFYSLSQTLLKITSPGFPDFYQGSEFWDLNLVDPDNRHPVNYSLRSWLLNEMKSREADNSQKLIKELLSTGHDGRIKQFLIYRCLAIRRNYRSLFEKGDYLPIETSGIHSNSIISFALQEGRSMALVVAPRFLTGLVQKDRYPMGRKVWGDTRIILPEDRSYLWNEGITGADLKSGPRPFVGDVLKRFPCAFLIGRNN